MRTRRTSRRKPTRTSRFLRSNARPIQLDASVVEDAMEFVSDHIDRFLTAIERDENLGLVWRTDVLWKWSGEIISPMIKLKIKDVSGKPRTVLLQLRLSGIERYTVEGQFFSRDHVYQELKERKPSEARDEYWLRLRRLMKEMIRRDAAGVIEIYVHPKRITVGGKDAYSWKYVRSSRYLTRLRDVLEHELTHAMEIRTAFAIASVPGFDTWFQDRPDMLQYINDPTLSPSERLDTSNRMKREIKRQTEYYNRYEELRAYMRNIVSEILPIMRVKMIDQKLKSSRAEAVEKDLSYALSQSETWNHMDHRLGQKSRNILLKGIVTALEDEGIIRIE